MRAAMVAIHTALTTFASHEWIRFLIDSLSGLQAIRRHNAITCIRISLHYYHHHMLLLESITNLMEARRVAGSHTNLHQIRAHTNIRGNDLADAAAKLAVRNFDIVPPAQTNRVDIREIAPRPTHWIMYTVKPPRPDPALAIGNICGTLRRP